MPGEDIFIYVVAIDTHIPDDSENCFKTFGVTDVSSHISKLFGFSGSVEDTIVLAYPSPSAFDSSKVTSLTVVKNASIFPLSVVSMVLMYFLSGITIIYAPIEISCFGHISSSVDNVKSVTGYPSIISLSPST